MKGILNIYKPRGITSSDVVVKCRKILGTKAIGHMGTLDPAGEGVLLLGVGKATRLFDMFLHKDKVYEAEFQFGYETDTLDGDGQTVAKTENIPTMSDIETVLSDFIGKQMQVPPQYSAKSVGGVRCYKLARAGKQVELPPCEVEIYSLELIRETRKNTYLFKIHCSAGTYVRSICRDVASKLDSSATMVSIKRLRCGDFCVEESVALERLESIKEAAVIPVEKALNALPVVTLKDEQYTPLCNGIKIPCEGRAGDFALWCKGELFGIAHTVNGIIKIKTYLRD